MKYLALLFAGWIASAAPILPSGYSSTTIATGLSSAVALAQTPDGRIFVTQQGGAARVIENNVLLGTNLFSIGVDSSGERGLLGIAVSPTFASDGYVYAYHTVPAASGNPAFNRVSRFTVTGNTAGSQTTLINLSNLGGATNHNGGAIHFGPDGKLYVATGDAAFNPANSQDLTNTHGKILRYNADGSIPTDNPFYNTAGAQQAIYQYGLRNPFTFAFQPGTGVLYSNDVGQNSWEEINRGTAGSNFGWNTTEGDFNQATFPNFTRPLYAYSHGGGPLQGFAIAGGAFVGDRYYFGDFSRGWVNYINPTTGSASTFGTQFGLIVDLMPAITGSGFYVLTRDTLYLVTDNNAVPEPATWVTAGAALWFGWRRLRRSCRML
jgi:glucose/arabinose dehydrogenase